MRKISSAVQVGTFFSSPTFNELSQKEVFKLLFEFKKRGKDCKVQIYEDLI